MKKALLCVKLWSFYPEIKIRSWLQHAGELLSCFNERGDLECDMYALSFFDGIFLSFSDNFRHKDIEAVWLIALYLYSEIVSKGADMAQCHVVPAFGRHGC